MVICMYFLNNSCRFGSRCKFEHIDIGSIVKNEVDVTLKGNQWPLSCFGPFKEHNCIPNFIEDQSFEEIRMMYLEAKLQNNIPAHQMQLAQMINDAKTKLQWLTSMNRDILNILVELYNQQDSSANPANTSLNPFASVGSSNTATTSNIFGTVAGGSAFGSGFGSSATSGASSSAGNIFGGGSISGQTTGNIFGTTPSASSNIFSKPAQQAPATNIFGMGQSMQPSNSVFGGPAVMGNGLFGSVQQHPQNSTSMFNSVATNAPPGGNMYGSAIQPSNTFMQQQPGSAPFGGGNIFGNNASTAAPATGGFGSIAAQPQQNTGLFNSVSFGAAQSTGSFGQFGSPMQSAPVVNNSSSQNMFLPAPTATPFGASVAENAFGAAAPPIVSAQQPPSATMYSKMESITPQHLAAFNADQFQLGRIPTMPPPKELCR